MAEDDVPKDAPKDDFISGLVEDITDSMELIANGSTLEHPSGLDWLEVQMGAFLFLSKPLPPLHEVQIIRFGDEPPL
jgi:hypothetical protein